MANEIKFRSEMPRIENLNAGDAFLISRTDGTAGYTMLADAAELRGAPFTYDKFTPSQLAALKGERGAPLTYDDLTAEQKAELVSGKLDVPTDDAPSTATISSLVGLNSSGSSINVLPSQIAEMVGIDHSILTEQIVPGEFATGRDGTRKQIYGRRICVSATLLPNNNNAGYIQIPFLINSIDTISSMEGFVISPYLGETNVGNDATLVFPFTGGCINNEEFIIYAAAASKSPYWGDNALFLSYEYKHLDSVGREFKADLFVKYTKL